MKANNDILRVVFMQPVLAPYTVPRYRELAKSKDLDVHVVLEAEKFAERPGWTPRPIHNCTLHIVKSLCKQKRVKHKAFNYTETFTKAIPYGISPLLYRIAPDIVLFCNPTQLLCALPYVLTAPCRVGLLMEDTLNSQSHKSLLTTWFRKVIYQRLDFVFCFSEEAVNYVHALELRARIYRSSWSIDAEWLTHGSSVTKNANLVTFLFVGQMNPRKGVMALLSAWKQFSPKNEDAKQIVLVGDGPLRKEAEAFCREHRIEDVCIIGGIPYDQIKQHYLNSDIFILPTMEDLFALVVTEAMAFGLPVMTSIYAGAAELIRQGENGWVFDSKDASSILQALHNAWDNRCKFSEMGKVSREIISRYTHKAVMAQMRADLHKEFPRVASRELF